MADISKRVWIRWGDGQPFENTSTLVLTVPSQTFVDVRVFKSHEAPPQTAEPSTAASGLEWAFSGVAKTQYRDGVCHKTWTHHIDSRTAHGAEPPVDEGDMFPEPDGVLCRETGRMANPETGEMSDYEEMWETVEAKTTGQDRDKFCLVATVGGPAATAHMARGAMIRIGQYIQCLLIIDDEVNVERWIYTGEDATDAIDGSTVGSEGWIRVVKLGPRVLPCPWFFRATARSVGATFEDKTQPWTWTLAEKSSW
ncbi:uncharacterized protein C8Q71DRAFT_764931 [Rhodofomes roseus]|uniref:Protein HRI1 n=1 Tax=Rhodofomes roseus TaxID=34475 RepID=A0ABQ8KCL5_9APHY|nr:uncharacterized protein C8Q71DRAFT_764931 [Rhodofomes roseus]KAH9835272.1 hypothetical protein C8Q71DRAFT_764931 [Rhodofomes roseus]